MTQIILPSRSRDDFVIETYSDAEDQFRWHMTQSWAFKVSSKAVDPPDTEVVETKIAAASSEGFDTEAECILDCYIATGWLPDTYSFGATEVLYKKEAATDG